MVPFYVRYPKVLYCGVIHILACAVTEEVSRVVNRNAAAVKDVLLTQTAYVLIC